MKQEDTLVVGVVAAHADTHHAAALGALLASKSFPTTAPGYRALLSWLRAFGELDVIARPRCAGGYYPRPASCGGRRRPRSSRCDQSPGA